MGHRFSRREGQALLLLLLLLMMTIEMVERNAK
jgi:hypothetical protein